MSNILKAQKDTRYFALSLHIGKEHKKFVKENLRQQLQTALSSLIKSGEIGEISIYTLNKTAERHGEFPVWNYLVLMQISKSDLAPQIMPLLKKMELPFLPDTIRMEELITTPNSSYLTPGEKAGKRRSKPFYAVEYVDVHEKCLEEFRNIMIKNNGPAMGFIMEHKSWCYNFLALETVTVFYHNTDYPTWNQIHVVGLYMDSILRYKADFSEGLDAANHISFKDNFDRLKQIRNMLFKSIGKKM
ncbi:hypothetical protein [Konateibacter massiliensis]|uniref:hypothetical protein n=1 Tax=Konateibacter massiliensis TaxID=2002841 RepID=UPI000C15F5E1|nr:hypothetical protein [Konateibacter massiliensis]